LTGCQFREYALRHRRDTRLHLLAELLDDGAVEAFLATEVVLDRGEVHTGALGERARARAFEAARGEQLERCFQDTAARVLAALVTSWAETADGSGHTRPRSEGAAC
jgi:hypothetical protein